MHNLFHVFILAIVQGLTEFLPVSSSAHLILVPKFLHWPDQGLAFDVATHVGTLCAVILYFKDELILMCKDWCKSLYTRKQTQHSRLAWAIGFATIPVGIAGLIFNNFISTQMRATWILAVTTIGFGLLLGFVAATSKQKRNETQINWRAILTIGCAQAIALIPGVSRSGITLTAGLFVGLTKQAAARFSFLLSIPVIILAGALELHKLILSPQPIDYISLGFGFIIAALTGYACIGVFLRILDKIGVLPFVIYRVALGITLLVVM